MNHIHACNHQPIAGYDIGTKQARGGFLQFAKKVRLENIFMREIRPLFNRMLRDYLASILALGRPQDATRYATQWDALLLSQYDRVQRAFKGDVTEDNGGKAFIRFIMKQDAERADALLDLALLEWRNQQAPLKAGIITDTNRRQMDQALIDARQVLQEQEREITPQALSLTASVLLARKFRVRNSIIAQTETQESAEATKAIEARIISGGAPDVLPPTFIEPVDEPLDVTKTWRDRDDKRVRDSHQNVNGGQPLPENGIFNVGGSRLQFPGDSSLGATAAQVINCRCFADYTVRAQ